MRIRATTDQDREVFCDTVHAAFGLFPDVPGEDGGGFWWSVLERDRSLLATAENGKPVGTIGAYALELTLPGAMIAPTTGVTNVGVVPTHRRQGVLSAMMAHQLADLRARGAVLSVLLASEATIYGRFGYGPAGWCARMCPARTSMLGAMPPR